MKNHNLSTCYIHYNNTCTSYDLIVIIFSLTISISIVHVMIIIQLFKGVFRKFLLDVTINMIYDDI